MPHQTGPVEQETQRLADAVDERLGEAIIDGSLEPGARIRDQDIAADLGVSRMPVREALQRFERIGLIEMSASRFTRVTEVSKQGIRDTFEFLGHQALSAVRMALPRMTDEEREKAVELSRAIADLARTIDTEDVPAVQHIHQVANSLWAHLAAATRNEMFSRTYSEAWFALERANRGVHKLTQTPETIVADFEEFADAIASGDVDAATAVVEREFQLIGTDADAS